MEDVGVCSSERSVALRRTPVIIWRAMSTRLCWATCAGRRSTRFRSAPAPLLATAASVKPPSFEPCPTVRKGLAQYCGTLLVPNFLCPREGILLILFFSHCADRSHFFFFFWDCITPFAFFKPSLSHFGCLPLSISLEDDSSSPLLVTGILIAMGMLLLIIVIAAAIYCIRYNKRPTSKRECEVDIIGPACLQKAPEISTEFVQPSFTHPLSLACLLNNLAIFNNAANQQAIKL